MTDADLITKHEGIRQFPYEDSRGKLTIGIGRNLTDVGLSLAEVETMFQDDLTSARHDCSTQIPCFDSLDDVRQAVLVDMAFNMGIGALCGFHETLAAVAAKQYDAAANLMLKSLWASQVPQRALEDATMMRNGEWPTNPGASNA